MDDFFDRIRSAGVTRPDDGRWFAGVATGLARRWDLDPILVRGAFVALAIFGGIGVVFYGLAWLLVPQDDGRIHLQEAIRGHITAGFIGAVLLSLAALGGSGSGHDGFWFGWAFPGGLILTAAVVFGIWWAAKQRSDAGSKPTDTGFSAAAAPPAHTFPSVYGSPATGTSQPPAGPAPSGWSSSGPEASEAARQARAAAKTQAQAEAAERTRVAKARRAQSGPSKMIVRLTLGIALLVAAAILVIGNANDWSEPVGLIAAATALAVIASGVIISGLNGRRAAGLIAVGLLLAFGTLVGVGAENAGVRSGQHITIIGDQTWTPHTPDAADDQFNLGVGQATLWLTDPAILSAATTADPLRVRARIGAGHLTVIVPDSVATQIDLEINAGDVSYPDGRTYSFDRDGNNYDGVGRQTLNTGPAGSPRMIVDIQQGAGQMDLRTTSGVSVGTIPSPRATGVSPAPTATAPTASAAATPTATATP
jgi:phage shock protein PspC (stress-responsive transcriptional regulator)